VEVLALGKLLLLLLLLTQAEQEEATVKMEVQNKVAKEAMLLIQVTEEVAAVEAGEEVEVEVVAVLPMVLVVVVQESRVPL
jgi:hypothetical protein